MLAWIGAEAMRRLAPVVVSSDLTGASIIPPPALASLGPAGHRQLGRWPLAEYFVLPAAPMVGVGRTGIVEHRVPGHAGRDGIALVLRAPLARLGAGTADRPCHMECHRAVRDAGTGGRRRCRPSGNLPCSLRRCRLAGGCRCIGAPDPPRSCRSRVHRISRHGCGCGPRLMGRARATPRSGHPRGLGCRNRRPRTGSGRRHRRRSRWHRPSLRLVRCSGTDTLPSGCPF